MPIRSWASRKIAPPTWSRKNWRSAASRCIAASAGPASSAAAFGDGATIGLRADMDALPIEEANRFAYRSPQPGQDARLRP